MKNNPKLTFEQKRKALYFKKWGLNEKNSTGDLRSDMRVWVDQADKEKADQEKNKFIPKVDVNSITESRLRYERLMRGDND